MKICMFSFSECDRYYITARRVAKSLADAGHDVTIVAYRGVLETDLEAYEYCDGYEIIRLELAIVRVLRSFPRIATGIRRRHRYTRNTEKNLQDTTGPKRTTKTRWYQAMLKLWYEAMLKLLYIDYYCDACSVSRRLHPKAYHAHDLVTLPAAWLSSRRDRAKLVYDMHELWIDREKKRSRLNRFLMVKLESFLIRRTDANIMAGYSSARELVRRYKIAEPIVVLNAASYLEYAPSTVLRDKLKIPTAERILLYSGIINMYRGIEEMIQSLKYLPDCCLVLLGYGPDYYLSSLQSLIASSGVKERVYFFGPVPFSEMAAYAMSADVGLTLHKNVGLNYYYVSPNKLFEFMVAGLPVVGSNFPDLVKFIEGYSMGVTCSPDSPQEVARAVQRVLEDDRKYQMMRNNALEAAKVINWENESKKLISIYSKFVEQ